jgi:hypothetical protein
MNYEPIHSRKFKTNPKTNLKDSNPKGINLTIAMNPTTKKQILKLYSSTSRSKVANPPITDENAYHELLLAKCCQHLVRSRLESESKLAKKYENCISEINTTEVE